MLAILVVIIVVIVAIFFMSKKFQAIARRCPRCYKESALIEKNRTLINKERVSKMERHYNYNKKGERTSSRDVRVYGTRFYYQVEYVCKFCGYTTTKAVYQDKY